jgi:hypothetical protein
MRRANKSSIFAALAVAAAMTTVSSTSSAFCRTTTVRPPPEADGSFECWNQGVPLYHPAQCLPYRLQNKESNIIPKGILSDRLARAFAAWTAPNPKCTPGITAIELAGVDDQEIVGYKMGERGRNVVGVASVWKYQGGSETLSLATLTFGADSGEVFDVDLEVNGTIQWSSTEEKPAIEGQHDLLTVLTHEVGHMLAIAHTPNPEATMFASYPAGTIDLRSLEADDHDAVCAIYPNRAERSTGRGLIPATACNLAPGDPNSTCGNPDISHGCTASPHGRTETGLITTGLLAGIALILSRRRFAAAK